MSTETESVGDWRQVANLRWQAFEDMTAQRDAAQSALSAKAGETASKAAELAALKAKLASYEANGVTCQTYGHVVGACAECNTHEDSPEALKADVVELVRITSEQATEIEALRAAAEKLHLVRIFLLGWKGSEPCKRNNMEQEVERWISAFDELFAAMQTKEAS